MKEKLKLTDERPWYKPFNYPFAYDAWLMSEQSHWLHTEVPLNEDIVDWKNKLNESEKHLLTQVFRFFTQADCFSDDTEILTSSGWKYFSDISYDDKVAQYTIGGKIEFVHPLHILHKKYDGEMIRFSAELVDVNHLITPTHNVVYSYKNEIKKENAKDVKLYQNKKLLTGGKTSGNKKYLSPLERIWIVFQADGNVKHDVNGSKLGFIPHRFGFSKLRKIERFRKLLQDANLNYRETIEHQITGPITNFYVESDIKMCKDFSWINLSEIDSEWCKEFCKEVVFWDGSKDSWGNSRYYNTNIKAANIVHAIACLAGFGGSIRKSEDNRSDKYNDCYRVIIGKNGHEDCQHVKKTIESYNGNIHCVSVPSGMILVRANGYSLISGNCDVAGGYVKNYLPLFPQPEIRMMLSSFAAREAIHIAGYSHLIETLGLPETIYNEFYDYEEMKEKHLYFEDFVNKDKKNIAQQIAAFSAFTEGMQLFSSFIMLLNFPRHGKMKGMGQIITWSIIDETLHSDSMIKLFRTFIEENRHIWKDDLKSQIYTIATRMVELENKFIDLAFSMGELENLTKDDVKEYIKYITDRRLISMGMKGIFKVKKNPLPWVEELVNSPIHTNFFENKSTDYGKGGLTGNWNSVWA